MKRPWLLGALALLGCPSYPPGDICGYPGACDDGGVDGSPGDALGDGGCDPKSNPGCIDPSKGVFVSPGGNDSNDGSQQNPLKTIGAGLAKAKSLSKSRLYVCLGTYPENVDVKDPIDLHGGFSCSDWSYAPANDATIAPPSGYAVHIASTTSSVSDLKLVSADGANPGDSSIAAFVDTSTVTFVRASLNAGKGLTGGNGPTGSNFTSVAQSDPSIKGNNATGIAGGGPHACSLCTDAKNSVGGSGGTGGGAPSDGSGGTPNYDAGAPNDGVGGTKAGVANTPACKNGDNGAAGSVGNAASPVMALGVVDTSGWKPIGGGAGSNGNVAQGGGGGGGGYDISNTSGGGGGGGCGGCGGASGTGGAGGGASMALLVYNSTVTLTQSELHAGNAGNGGTGGTGQTGQPGGNPGGDPNFIGCKGGSGGTGGAGGSGAGGAGGVSVGILWKGSNAPTLDSATTTNTNFGAKGTKGAGGSPGVNDGLDGVAQALLQIP